MLTIEVKSNRKVIAHLEVHNVQASEEKTTYCITNILGTPKFVMPPDSEWNHVVRAAIDCAVLEGKKELYDREQSRDRDHPSLHPG